MSIRRNTFLMTVLAAAALAAALAMAQAQTQSQQHQHQHYEKPAAELPPGPQGQIAPRLQNLGTHAFLVNTRIERAQAFFNQGVRLTYGFNHAEAGRAFREAARLDPNLAMAWWGQALVLGPNINSTMNPDDEPKAYELIQKALAMKDKATPRERDYIDALARRYTGKAEDRAAADRAFADAMREVARKYPDDLDAATIFAEALMDLRPWNYWTRDGKPYPETEELLRVLHSVVERHPNHPGALHYLIHVWEPTKTPERALEYADRLLPLMPGAGHMVHMPSHIYYRVGLYEKAAHANELAIAADEDYIVQCRAQGLYPLGYYPHNIHFLWIAATMQGRSREAIEAAKKTASKAPIEALKDVPILQGFLIVPYGALVRFGQWEEILKLPEPVAGYPFLRGMWHYARGMAYLRTNRLSEAERELEAVRRIVADPEKLDAVPGTFSSNTPSRVLRIAPEALAGEIAAARKDWDTALLHLHRGVLYEDSLEYIEPPDWHYPVRHSLGAVLLAAGRAAEAEVVYWDDLNRNPNNGWALFGLMQALRAQGKNDQAADVEKRFQQAWARADVKLTSSRF